MPTIVAHKPFIDILTSFMRRGTHPGEFIISLITRASITEVALKADNLNAERLWHCAAIVYEYVPQSLRTPKAYSRHMEVMRQGNLNFDSLGDDDKAYYNYMKDWDIPNYVPIKEYTQPQAGRPNLHNYDPQSEDTLSNKVPESDEEKEGEG